MRNATKILILSTLFLTHSALAGERFEFYNGIRQMGMGGATIAVVNDETSLIQNPAALGKLRNTFLTVADPELELNSETQPMIETNLGAVTDIQKILDLCKANEGKHFHFRGQVFPSFVMPNFGMGFLGKYAVDGEVPTATPTQFRLDYTYDYAFITGYNFRLFDGIVKIGFNARAITRGEIAKNIPVSTTNLKVSEQQTEGIGIASDIGLIITAPILLLPTLSAVVRDVGNTRYNLQSNDDEAYPTTSPQTIDAALAIFPIGGRGTRFSVTAEYQDVMDAFKEKNANRRIHAGVEMNVKDIFFIRAGYNQRYWTAGLEFVQDYYQLQLASFGEDIGTIDTPREDRRYAIKFAIRF